MIKLKAQQKIGIQKPVDVVFEAIVSPEQMSRYFIASSSGRLEEGQTVQWTFPEFPEEFPVVGKRITANEYISFDWSGGEENNLVEIFLSVDKDGSTVVKIVEGEKEYNEHGIKWLGEQTGGWANFLACLKAYLEYGINLRKGAFDFMKP